MTWTKTPPTEAGDYWWREREDSPPDEWRVLLVDEREGILSWRGPLVVRAQESVDLWWPVDVAFGEWWSEPITRPGEGTDWRAVAGDLGERLHNMLGAGGTELYDAAVARYTKGG